MPKILFKILLSLAILVPILFSTIDIYAEEKSGSDTTYIKAIHIVAFKVSVDKLIEIVQTAAELEYNTIIIQVSKGVELENSPWTPIEGALNKDDLRKVIKIAQDNDIEIIPEIKFLTHQEKLLENNYPHLMYNSVTYDPSKKEIYDIIEPLIDELIELFSPPAIHIGHDESPGWPSTFTNTRLNKSESPLTAELYLLSVKKLNSILSMRNINTWMWGDMLVSPSEFPSMLSRHLHGSYKGFGKELRKRIPREVTIADWHYYDKQTEYPSIKSFSSENFTVLGASFKNTKSIRNLTKYASNNGASGMITTTWFLVPHQKWAELYETMEISSKYFELYFK